MTETTETAIFTEYENNLRHSLGIMLMKPDALEAGIVEELVDYTYSRLKKKVPDIELVGAILIPSFNESDIERIYPDLETKYKDAFKVFYKQGPLVVVFWGSETGNEDLWVLLKNIRGKITQGSGLEDSIRSIIPLPGQKEKYKELTLKLESGNLTSEDYIELCKSLVHTPENIKEVAGLFLSLAQEKTKEVFGRTRSENLRKEFANYTT